MSERVVNTGSGIVFAAIVGSSILAWGISNSRERYQIAAVGETIVRLDTREGDMLACNQAACVKLVTGVSEQRIGPIGVVVDKTKKQSALPKSPETAPQLPATNQE